MRKAWCLLIGPIVFAASWATAFDASVENGAADVSNAGVHPLIQLVQPIGPATDVTFSIQAGGARGESGQIETTFHAMVRREITGLGGDNLGREVQVPLKANGQLTGETVTHRITARGVLSQQLKQTSSLKGVPQEHSQLAVPNAPKGPLSPWYINAASEAGRIGLWAIADHEAIGIDQIARTLGQEAAQSVQKIAAMVREEEAPAMRVQEQLREAIGYEPSARVQEITARVLAEEGKRKKKTRSTPDNATQPQLVEQIITAITEDSELGAATAERVREILTQALAEQALARERVREMGSRRAEAEAQAESMRVEATAADHQAVADMLTMSPLLPHIRQTLGFDATDTIEHQRMRLAKLFEHQAEENRRAAESMRVVLTPEQVTPDLLPVAWRLARQKKSGATPVTVGEDIRQLLAKGYRTEETNPWPIDGRDHHYHEVVLQSHQFDEARLPEYLQGLSDMPDVHNFSVMHPTEAQARAVLAAGGGLTAERVIWFTRATSQGEFRQAVGADRARNIVAAVEKGRQQGLQVVARQMTAEDWAGFLPIYAETIGRRPGGENLWPDYFARGLALKQSPSDRVMIKAELRDRKKMDPSLVVHDSDFIVRTAADTEPHPDEVAVARPDHGLISDWLAVSVWLGERLLGILLSQYRHAEQTLHGRAMALKPREAQIVDGTETYTEPDYHANDIMMWEQLNYLHGPTDVVPGDDRYRWPYDYSAGRDFPKPGTEPTDPSLEEKKVGDGGQVYPVQAVRTYLRIRPAPAGAMPKSDGQRPQGYLDMRLRPDSATMKAYFDARAAGLFPLIDEFVGGPAFRDRVPAPLVWDQWHHLALVQDDQAPSIPRVPKDIQLLVIPINPTEHDDLWYGREQKK